MSVYAGGVKMKCSDHSEDSMKEPGMFNCRFFKGFV